MIPRPALDNGSLLLVGHGSRDPRSAAALGVLTRNVAALLPRADVRLAFLELSPPSLEETLETTSAPLTVVPLLLGKAFHARIDLPGRLGAAAAAGDDDGDRPRPRLAEPLGPHPMLVQALADHARRLAATSDSLVLLATGSSDPRANDAVAVTARQVQHVVGLPTRAAFVTCDPGPEVALRRWNAEGYRRPAVLPYFLAPGLLLTDGIERARGAGSSSVVAPTLSGHPTIARLVLHRAQTASTRWDVAASPVAAGG